MVYRSTGIWPRRSAGISLRQEVTNLLRGVPGELGVGRYGLLRRLIRDENTNPILCGCRDLGTKFTGRPSVCSKCLNVGYLWTEEVILFHKKSGVHGSRQMHTLEDVHEYGQSYDPRDVFYLEYRVHPALDDMIIELTLDEEGNIIQPYSRERFHDIKAIEQYRCDGGRVEFYQCSCTELTIGYFGQPILKREPLLGELP